MHAWALARVAMATATLHGRCIMTQETPPAPKAPVSSRPRQAITGVMPPLLGEARIREEWPTVLGIMPPVALLAKALMKTFILAPVGFLLLLPLFAMKFGPFVCRRYTLTNRRLMIQRG